MRSAPAYCSFFFLVGSVHAETDMMQLRSRRLFFEALADARSLRSRGHSGGTRKANPQRAHVARPKYRVALAVAVVV